MEISSIHTQILVHKTDFQIKVFALGLALKQRRNSNNSWAVTMPLQVSIAQMHAKNNEHL